MNLQKALTIFAKLEHFSPAFILAGSARRGKIEDLHDLDVIYLGKEMPTLPFGELISGAENKREYKIDGEQVDLIRATKETLPFALLYFIGSKKFNIRMRAIAKKKGYRLNQESLRKIIAEVDSKKLSSIELAQHLNEGYIKETDGFLRLFSKPILCEDERDVFEILEMDYVKPNERIK